MGLFDTGGKPDPRAFIMENLLGLKQGQPFNMDSFKQMLVSPLRLIGQGMARQSNDPEGMGKIFDTFLGSGSNTPAPSTPTPSTPAPTSQAPFSPPSGGLFGGDHGLFGGHGLFDGLQTGASASTPPSSPGGMRRTPPGQNSMGRPPRAPRPEPSGGEEDREDYSSFLSPGF